MGLWESFSKQRDRASVTFTDDCAVVEFTGILENAG
jgi:hypothetical protein